MAPAIRAGGRERVMSVIYPSREQPAAAVLRPQALAGSGYEVAAGRTEAIPRTFLAAGDIAAVFLAFVVAQRLAPSVQWLLLPTGPLRLSLPIWLSVPDEPSFQSFPPMSAHLWIPLAMIPPMLLFMHLLGGYTRLVSRTRSRLVMSAILAPVLALSTLTLALFASKNSNSSRVFVFTFGATSVLYLLTYRSTLRWYKRRRLDAGAYAKNVLVVGSGPAARWMRAHFQHNVPRNQFHLVGWLTGGPATAGDDSGVPLCGSVEDLGALLISSPIHEVIAVQPSRACEWLSEVVESCDYFRVRLHIVPEALLTGSVRDLRLMFRSDPLRLPEVVLSPPHFETDALFIKRAMDIIVSAALLVVLSPLFLLIAICIKLTTPHLDVFYAWHVIGLKGRPFTGYKFTTMVANADQQKQALMDRNEMSGPVFKIKDDPRITPLGRILRKYSLNELPQLWSVLKGDMSLVGPRPAGPHELERYELWHKRKLCVQPGVTCLWQVSGRNRIHEFDQWVRLDLEYIDKWNLWLDVRILVRTVWTVLAGTGS